MTLKKNQVNTNVVCGAIAVLIAFPIALLASSLFGHTYEQRVWIYAIILFWPIIGAISLNLLVKKNNPSRVITNLFYWIVSVWFWPLLVFLAINRKNK